MGRGSTETDLEMFGETEELTGSDATDGENQQFKTYAGQMNAQTYGALPPTKDYIYEENKDDMKDKSKEDSYHALAGSRDFELQKMPVTSDQKKLNKKSEPNSSYHRLGSEPSKPSALTAYNPSNPLEPLEDERPVKLVSKEKSKAKPEKQAIDDIESFLLDDNDL